MASDRPRRSYAPDESGTHLSCFGQQRSGLRTPDWRRLQQPTPLAPGDCSRSRSADVGADEASVHSVSFEFASLAREAPDTKRPGDGRMATLKAVREAPRHRACA